MERAFIFIIGGTGCRIMKSLIFLTAMDNPHFKNKTLVPIVIESDLKSPALTALDNLVESYQVLEKYNKEGQGYFKNSIADVKKIDAKDLLENVVNRSNGASEERMTFINFLGIEPESEDSETQFDYDLLSLLYDNSEDNLRKELFLNVSEGFYGNPNIGSAVFTQLDKIEDILKDNKFTNNSDEIFVIGSLFGGMGASGIPFIVDRIKNSNEGDINQAKISVLMGLPYFSLKTNNVDSPIVSSIFISKTKHALNYYYESGIIDKFDRVYFIGENPIKSIYENHPSGEKQDNPAHHVELIAAYGLLRAIGGLDDLKVNQKKSYEYLREDIDGSKGGKFIDLGEIIKEENGNEEFWQSFTSFSFFIKYYNQIVKGYKSDDKKDVPNYYRKFFVNDNPKDINDKATIFDFAFEKGKFQKNFEKGFANMYWEWLEEMAGEGKKSQNQDGTSTHSLPFKPFKLNENRLNFFVTGREVKGYDVTTSFFGNKDLIKSDLIKATKHKDLKKLDEHLPALFFTIFSKTFKNYFSSQKK